MLHVTQGYVSDISIDLHTVFLQINILFFKTVGCQNCWSLSYEVMAPN